MSDERALIWERRCDALENAIQRARTLGDLVFAERLNQELEAVLDERCECCGCFEDDPSDLHAEWCRFSMMPRPSIDWDSDIPVLEQLRQILIVNGMQW